MTNCSMEYAIHEAVWVLFPVIRFSSKNVSNTPNSSLIIVKMQKRARRWGNGPDADMRT
jgi:hypothetical protein